MTRRTSRGEHDLHFKEQAIRGLLTAPRIAAVPATPSWLLGACSFEGRAVSVVDIAALAHGTIANQDVPVVVFVATPAGLIGIPADAPLKDEAPIGDVLEGRDVVVDAATLPERISRALIECGFPPRG